MTGQTPVNLVKSFKRFNGFIIIDSNKTNTKGSKIAEGRLCVGWGTVTAGVNDKPMRIIPIGEMTGFGANFTVPNGKKAMFGTMQLMSYSTKTEFKFYLKLPFFPTFLSTNKYFVLGNNFTQQTTFFSELPPGSDVYVTGKDGGQGSQLFAELIFLLLDV